MREIVNPFLLFGYVSEEYFCDREHETAELISALRNGRNVTLRSPRRIGKTGLIHHVFRRMQQETPECRCFYVDIMATKSLSDFVMELGKAVIGQLDTPLQKAEGYITKFFKSCRLYFSADPLSGSPKLGIDLVAEDSAITLDEIFAYIKNSERECYIAIDEFQQIAQYPETNMEALLRSHIQQLTNVHFIFAGSKQHLMSDIFNSAKRPFYRSTEKMNLDVISENKYFSFAAQWMQTIGVDLPEDSFHKIYSLTDGGTWYVQYILNRLFEIRPDRIDDETITSCLNYIIHREEDDYKKMYNLLTSNQGAVLKAIAQAKILQNPTANEILRQYNLPAPSSVKRALDFLVDNEYVYQTDNGYKVYDIFMSLWLCR